MINTGSTVTATTHVNLRTGAGTSHPVVATLRPNDALTVCGGPMVANGLTWWKLDYDGVSVWAAESVKGRVLLQENTPFNIAITFTLRWEGGYSADPHDPGNWVDGELRGTKYGISARAYPHLDIKNLTEAQAREIYRTDYWLKSGASVWHTQMACCIFDCAVNAGIARAQSILAHSGGGWLTYNELRREWYRSLSQFERYGVAWLRRVNELDEYLA